MAMPSKNVCPWRVFMFLPPPASGVGRWEGSFEGRQAREEKCLSQMPCLEAAACKVCVKVFMLILFFSPGYLARRRVGKVRNV